MGSEVVVVPSIFGTIGFIVWVAINGMHRRQQIKLLTEFNNRLLERIESLKDFSEFLQTDGGTRFIERFGGAATAPDIRMMILRAVQTGLVLLSLGTGLLLLASILRARFPEGGAEVLIVSGVIALSLGVGFLPSGGASHRLADGMQRRYDG